MSQLFKWSNEYLVGFKEIDDQHKNFVNSLNNLFTILQEGKSKEELVKTLKSLIEYSKIHFSTEEQLFDKYNFPQAEEHKDSHKKFQLKVKEIEEKLDKKLLTIDFTLLDFLEDWFTNHLKVEDSKYVEYFKEIGVNEY